MMQLRQTPVQSGDRAPDFVVPAVHDDRTISLGDYVGKSPLLLGLFRGMYCPFCRRAIAQMAYLTPEIARRRVARDWRHRFDNARLYFQFRPIRMPLGADLS
jgi:hypothetical protein